MNSKLKKILCNGAFLLLCIGVSVYFVLSGEDFGALVSYIRSSSQVFWIAGFALVIAFILCESVTIFYLLRAFGDAPQLSHCFLYSFVGFFFSLVTPTASGGQPMQLVFMKRDGLSLTRCVIALLIVTIAYKSVLILVGILVLFACPPYIAPLLEPAMGWIYLGIVLNVICVGAMLALVLAPSVAKTIVFTALRIARKFVAAERVDRWQAHLTQSLENYKEASRFVREHRIVTLNVMLITIVQRFLLFGVTYVVLLSFDVSNLSLLDATLLQGSISLSADMLPLPGGLGISEHLYNVMFQPICGQLTAPTLVISRGLSFYAQLLVCAVFSAVAYLVVFGAKKGNEK